ncbi:hypothetical protein HAX54_040354 [Datura stramonium]|uniref:FAS1 domain-containing protein n=1 Tax=Datura stramonium TaxID=4076 RepID=A0ABS8SKA1_DATST|nr:hypothetical protein [Datura stramonium]
MAHQRALSLILVSSFPLLFILFPQIIQPQLLTAPTPGPTGPVDIFVILKKTGHYNTFIKLLDKTQIGSQINNQVNNSNQGMTVFAPLDDAFSNLPGGTLNKLNDQQKVQLIQYHIIAKFYTFDDLQTVSNPVRTQATGQNGEPSGLYFINGQNNQVNVSSGVVEANVYNAIRKDPPLAVYQLDKVLLPLEFTDAKSPSIDDAPAPVGDSAKKGSGADKTAAKEPSPVSTPNDAKAPSTDDARAPAPAPAGASAKKGSGADKPTATEPSPASTSNNAKAPYIDDVPAPVPAPATASVSVKKSSGADKTTAKESSPASIPNDVKRINIGILGLMSGVFLIGALSS